IQRQREWTTGADVARCTGGELGAQRTIVLIRLGRLELDGDIGIGLVEVSDDGVPHGLVTSTPALDNEGRALCFGRGDGIGGCERYSDNDESFDELGSGQINFKTHEKNPSFLLNTPLK